MSFQSFDRFRHTTDRFFLSKDLDNLVQARPCSRSRKRKPKGVNQVLRIDSQDLIQITNNTTTSPQRHVDWSRDGSNRILFDWGWGNDDSGGAVWMMRYPGGEPECLITDEGVGSQWEGVYPKWSPDGTKIVFGPDPKGYLVIFDITSKTTLSLGKKWGSQAAWSPSGRYILSSWALYEPDVDLVSYVPFGGSFAWAPTEDIICINRSGDRKSVV